MVGGRTLSSLYEMCRLLGEVRCSDNPDAWKWGIGTNGDFSVAETRRWIDDIVLPVGVRKTRWCDLVPRKVNIFIWRLLLERIPTRVALSKRGLELPSIVCAVCGGAPESIVHLFFSVKLQDVFGSPFLDGFNSHLFCFWVWWKRLIGWMRVV